MNIKVCVSTHLLGTSTLKTYRTRHNARVLATLFRNSITAHVADDMDRRRFPEVLSSGSAGEYGEETVVARYFTREDVWQEGSEICEGTCRVFVCWVCLERGRDLFGTRALDTR